MSDAAAQTKAIRHPFETPAGEAFFKGLLWAMLLLQVAVFAKMYQNIVRTLPERSHAAWRGQ